MRWSLRLGLVAIALPAACGVGAPGSTATGTRPSAAEPVVGDLPAAFLPDAGAATVVEATTGTPIDTGGEGSAGAPAGMRELPAAFYLMGARVGGAAEERPLHEVALATFYLDATEVTVGAYDACLAASACDPPHPGPFCNEGVPGRGNHPINCVDFPAAERFCAFAGKRLPTEREWEYAASGLEKRRFSWGEEDPDGTRACYMHSGTCPVGSFAPGAFGLLDLSGNVWEWTASFFAPYPDEAPAGAFRVYRGGSWSRRFPKWLVNTLRNRYPPDRWSAALGLRCARTRAPVVCPADAEPRGGGCVRTRGTPACELGYAWNGSSCTLGGHAALPPGGGWPAATASATPAPSSRASAAPAVIARARSPANDADCLAHWPRTPAAYRLTGGDFYALATWVHGAGCTKRDMGRGWMSACCAE